MAGPTSPASGAAGVGVPPSAGAVNTQVTQAGFVAFPREKMASHTVPSTPLPTNLKFDEAALPAGNAANGQALVTKSMCVACHMIRGTTMAGNLGPNLTHVGSRTTIAAGTLTNTLANMERWIDHPQEVKPGNQMPDLHLTDAQVHELARYLESLK